MADFRIKYIIDADGKKAKSELEGIDDKLARLGGKTGLSASTLDGLSLGMTSLAAGITTVTAAAVSGTIALFELTRSTAEFGSEIFDATEKTGLSAEAISAMKFAADQSGTSLDTVTSAISKYTKQVGAAVDGSEKAEKALIDLGVNPQEAMQDLDGSLAKVFDRIAKAKPGYEQITLAQKAFGKSGADLLPFLKSFDGDLEGLIAKARELGATMTDTQVQALDEFGDQLDTLSVQLAGVGRAIGTEFMPLFMDLATGLSTFVKENKDEIRDWATVWRDAAVGLIATMRELSAQSEETTGQSLTAWGSWSYEIIRHLNPVNFVLDQMLRKMVQVGANQNAIGAEIGGSVSPLLGVPSVGDVTGTRTKRGGGSDPAREAERQERERVQAIRKNLADELALRLAKDRTALAQIETFYAQGAITEEQAFMRSQQLIDAQLRFKLQAYQDTAKLLAGNAEEEERMRREIAVIEQDVFTASYNQAKELADFEKKSAKEREQEIENQLDLTHRLLMVELERLDAAEKLRQEQSLSLAQYHADQGLGGARAPEGSAGGFFGENGFGGGLTQATGDIQNMNDVMAQLGKTAEDVFMQMGAGLGAMVESWVILGDQADVSMKKMLASVLAGVAAQAATLAVFHTAMGIAALTPWGAAMYGSPVLHFKAAALWAGIAVGTALAGRAVAGDSFKDGGRGGSSSRSSSSASSDNMSPISKQSENTFVSGRGTVFQQMANAIEGLVAEQKKLQAMKAGEVLVKGSAERPGFIAGETVKGMQRNAGLANSARRTMGT